MMKFVISIFVQTCPLCVFLYENKNAGYLKFVLKVRVKLEIILLSVEVSRLKRICLED